MPQIIKAVPNARLLIIGDGPDREKLHLMAANLGAGDHICWAGEKDQASVIPYYAIMDVVVVPSQFEGFGLVAAEAMAASCPVVASNIDGLNEVVEHGKTGFLTPVGDSKAFAEKIIYLLTDPVKARAMGKEGYRKVVQFFSIETFTKAILNAYK